MQCSSLRPCSLGSRSRVAPRVTARVRGVGHREQGRMSVVVVRVCGVVLARLVTKAPRSTAGRDRRNLRLAAQRDCGPSVCGASSLSGYSVGPADVQRVGNSARSLAPSWGPPRRTSSSRTDKHGASGAWHAQRKR